MMRRAVAAVGFAALVIAVVLAGWRWAGQRVDVVIVNASGREAQFTWQPQLFAEPVTVSVGGCESKSVVLLAGETWRFDSDILSVDSTSVVVPFTAQISALEVWLDRDGTARLIPAHAVDGPIAAPYPSCPDLEEPA
jgi:hypothetical protein